MQQGAMRHDAPPPQPTTTFQPPALAPGTVLLNRYSIEGYIGGGGFGHIYRARDRALGYRRAIKEAFYRDPNTQRQFRLEAEFLLNARHPNLVRGYAVFEQAGRLYLVMDYVDGKTLEDIAIEQIRRTGRPPNEAQVLDWILPICDALHELHSQPAPIIHRDVKPANIKMSVTLGIPVLIDLGLAKLYLQGQQTIGAALAFTPGYAPPEQYQAMGATDQRTDVYGLGATLFYLLTGYQPTESPARLSATALPALRTLNPHVSAQTETVVLKAMALDPTQRQQTARDLEAELRACRAALPSYAAGSTRAATLQRIAIENDTYSSLPRVGEPLAVTCLRCETSNASSARFCMQCGAPLRIAVADPLPVAALASLHRGALAGDTREADAAPPSPTAAVNERRSESPDITMSAPGRTGPRARNDVAALYAPRQRMLAQDTVSPPPVSQQEAWASILAFLAMVCVALSLTAPFFMAMLIFLPPALALSIWSLVTLRKAHAPLEFQWLASVTLGIGGLWLVVWLAELFTSLVHLFTIMI